MAEHPADGPDTLRVPFIFVPHGDPPPLEWRARHPGWVKFPAVMIPRNSPAHPANGGRYPSFPALPSPPRVAPVAQAEEWPLGRPVAAGLRGAMSRLEPGGAPPRYPGGHGAPAGMFPWVEDDPVAAFLRANAVIDRVTGGRPARTPAAGPVEGADQGEAATPKLLGSGGQSDAQSSGATPAGPVEVAEWASPTPFPVPLPPVFLPGTPQNEDIVRSLIDLGRALERAAEGVFHNEADKTPGPGKTTTVDDLLGTSSPGQKTKGKASQYDRPGGMEDADRDFDALHPTDVRTDPRKPGLRIGTLPDGRTVNVRPGSSDSRPTLEIYNPKKNRKIKIRYGEKNDPN